MIFVGKEIFTIQRTEKMSHKYLGYSDEYTTTTITSDIILHSYLLSYIILAHCEVLQFGSELNIP